MSDRTLKKSGRKVLKLFELKENEDTISQNL
jgi:hypothetical protein